jgi:TonB family protein
MISCASQSRPLQLVGGEGPRYPAGAKELGLEGRVMINYDVDERGQVVNARVVSSSPAGVFDQAALQAVSSWRFNPMQVGGVVKESKNLLSEVVFSLDGKDRYDSFE